MRRRTLRARPGRAARVRHTRAPRLAVWQITRAHHPPAPLRHLCPSVLAVRVPMIYSCHRRSHRRRSPPYHHRRHQHHRHHRHHRHHCHRQRHHCRHRHLPHRSSAAAAAHAPGRMTRTLVHSYARLTSGLFPLSPPPFFAAQVQTRMGMLQPARRAAPSWAARAAAAASTVASAAASAAASTPADTRQPSPPLSPPPSPFRSRLTWPVQPGRIPRRHDRRLCGRPRRRRTRRRRTRRRRVRQQRQRRRTSTRRTTTKRTGALALTSSPRPAPRCVRFATRRARAQ